MDLKCEKKIVISVEYGDLERVINKHYGHDFPSLVIKKQKMILP